jgi:hypothetical protein
MNLQVAKSQPRDDVTLLVRGAVKSMEENKRFRLYYDWADHKHRNAGIIGLYGEKTVQLVGRITKVVACVVNANANSVTVVGGRQTLGRDEKDRILGATEAAKKRIIPNDPNWRLEKDHQFFLCDTLEETDFRKASPHGMRGRRYFDLEEVLGRPVPGTVGELARLLREHEWE